MSSLDLPCPQCGTILKVPDRSYLGKKGKCRKCQHRFIMEEPAPTPLEFEAVHTPAASDQTLMGEFVKWVPENAPEETFSPPTPPPATRPVTPPAPAAAAFPSAFPPIDDTPAVFSQAAADPGISTPIRKLTRKRNNSSVVVAGIMGGLAVVLAAIVYFGGFLESKPARSVSRKSKSGSAAAEKKKKAARAAAAEDSSREPLNLALLPDGVEVVIHLRPAQLWADTPAAKEFRYAFGPLAKWLEDEETKKGAIRKLVFQEPRNVDELLIGLIPRTYPTPPDVAFVVRTVKPVKQSELIDGFTGDVENIGPKEVFVNEQWAYVIKDTRTYAGCPVPEKTSMVQNLDQAPLPRDELENVLKATDKNRLVTIVGINDTLFQHQESVVPASVRPAMVQFLEWCTSDARSFAVSVKLDEAELDSEILLGIDRGRSLSRVHGVFEEKLETTPKQILDMVLQTHPDTIGLQKLVGRFPAMIKAYALSTDIEEGTGVLALRTVLPERAAPNLAAAGLFTWDLTNRSTFGAERPAEYNDPSQPAEQMTIAQRLQKKVPEVDFRDEMMYSCFNFIGDDIGVSFKMEGDDLKAAGVTQNMKQKFKMENAPATEIIHKIVDKLGLCIVVDEDKNIVHVTSLKAAQDRGWKPFPLK